MTKWLWQVWQMKTLRQLLTCQKRIELGKRYFMLAFIFLNYYHHHHHIKIIIINYYNHHHYFEGLLLIIIAWKSAMFHHFFTSVVQLCEPTWTSAVETQIKQDWCYGTVFFSEFSSCPHPFPLSEGTIAFLGAISTLQALQLNGLPCIWILLGDNQVKL